MTNIKGSCKVVKYIYTVFGKWLLDGLFDWFLAGQKAKKTCLASGFQLTKKLIFILVKVKKLTWLALACWPSFFSNNQLTTNI